MAPWMNARAQRVVHHAYERGIRYFDTSPYYGRGLSERRLGAALRGLRSRVFLATKGGRQDLAAFDFRAAPLVASLEESLRRLQTDWIDLYQLHDVEFAPAFAHPRRGPAGTLERLRAQGKIRFIGISAYPPSLLRDIAENFPLDTVLSYCQHNLLIENLGDLAATCAARGSALLNASVLHMGVLTAAGASPWHPAPPAVHEASARAAALAAVHRREDLAQRRPALRLAGNARRRHAHRHEQRGGSGCGARRPAGNDTTRIAMAEDARRVGPGPRHPLAQRPPGALGSGRGARYVAKLIAPQPAIRSPRKTSSRAQNA